MSVESLTSLVTTLIALLFALVPSTRAWFLEQPVEYQSALKGGSALVIAIISIILGCLNIIVAPTVCDLPNILKLFETVIVSVVLGFAGASIVQSPFTVAKVRAIRREMNARKVIIEDPS
jgi:type IV secretory pathway VirB2 component (pilin)